MSENVDVILYLQKLQDFLNTDNNARNYFLKNRTLNEFLSDVKKISEKNKSIGNPIELTKEQFENIIKKPEEIFFNGNNIIYLNKLDKSNFTIIFKYKSK